MGDFVRANNHTVDATLVRRRIIDWGQDNFRAFPWRATRDPYRILISEVMLHRTQAGQVVSVYERFVQEYPDVSSLTQASIEELHQILNPLGLRWRVGLMFEMAQMLTSQFNAQIPAEKAELTSLPGISDYIAGAVRCFAWDLPEPLADTNTVRVIGRLFGLMVKESSRRNRQFQDLLAALLDRESPRLYNYAVLDLASKICLRRTKPFCEICPIVQWCLYGRQAT